jgi:hypothetical protein
MSKFILEEQRGVQRTLRVFGPVCESAYEVPC